MTDRIIRKSNG